jgi:DNA uptake protein ComE-like DNA-binding protein
MSNQVVMSMVYPDANLVFQPSSTMLVMGQAFRDTTTLRSMPRSLSLQFINSDGKTIGEKSFANNSIGMSIASCYFTASFNLAKDLIAIPSGLCKLKLIGDFKAEDGSLFTRFIEKNVEMGSTSSDAVAPYESWFPSVAKDGGIGMEWQHPLADEVFAGRSFPVLVSTKKQPRLDYPVLELLDNQNKLVIFSAWVNQKGWNINTPNIRASVDAPSDLKLDENKYQLRLGIFDIELSSRVATSYYPLNSRAGLAPANLVAVFKKTNLNNANAKMMAENIPGIGPSKANLIVQNRPIKEIEDLLKISGFSAMSIEAMRNHVEV